MSPLRQVVGDVAGHAAPGGTHDRVRFRVALNMLRNNAVVFGAIVLVVGYQVMVRWGDRILGSR